MYVRNFFTDQCIKISKKEESNVRQLVQRERKGTVKRERVKKLSRY